MGAAALVGTAVPVARIFAYDNGQVQAAQASSLADGLLWFAPGLIGFGLLMHLGRVLYARQAGRHVAAVTGIAWLAVAVLGFVLTSRWDGVDVVGALAAAMSCGMLAGSLALLVVLRRQAGSAVMAGLPRAAVAAVVGALAAGFVGQLVASPASSGGWGRSLVFALLSGLAVVAVYSVVAALVARQDLKLLLRRGE